MANNPMQTLHQAIKTEFGLQNTSDLSKFSSIGGTNPQMTPRFAIPQLKIPQLQLQANAANAAAQQESLQAAETHNQLLLNEIQLRQRQRSESDNKTQLVGFMIPQLGATPVEPLLSRLERGVDKLQIGDWATNTDTPASPLIDLSSTVITGNSGAPPKESASKARQLTSRQNFDIPFIACDRSRSTPTGDVLARRRSINYEKEEPANSDYREQPGPIGFMLDAVVAYPMPRKPHLIYAVTPLEQQRLRMCHHKDYFSQGRRFRFDTPSPDELVKQALQKSWRVSRT